MLSVAQNGEWVWAKDFLPYYQQLNETNDDGFYLSGFYRTDTLWNNPPLIQYNQNEIALLIKFDGDGNWNWYKGYGSEFNSGIGWALSMKEASSGNIYSNIQFWPPYVFEGDSVSESPFASPETVIAKYSPDGNLIWNTVFRMASVKSSLEKSHGVFGEYICVDNNENIYISGSCFGFPMLIGDSIVSINYPPYISKNFLCKFDSAGNFKWLNYYFDGSRGAEIHFNEITNQVLLISGFYTDDPPYFGNDTIYDITSNQGVVAFINAENGNFINYFLSPIQFRTGGEMVSCDINAYGNIYMVHFMNNDTILFAGDSIISNAGDFVVLKYTPDFNPIWAKLIGGEGNQGYNDLKVNQLGDVFIGYICHNLLVCDSDTLWQKANSTSNGIIQLDSLGNFIRLIGGEQEGLKCLRFTFDGPDVIVQGQALGDSVGEFPIEDWFLARYHPYAVGIEENELNLNKLVVYPNPAKETLSISSPKILKEIEIFDISGCLVRNVFFEGKQKCIDVSGLPVGQYIIRAIGNDEVLVRKFIVYR
jgi:hypothetical protein